MSREDEFDGLVDMVPLEDLEAANKRTQQALDTFSSSIQIAVERYPQGDLYDFLALQTVVFAVAVQQGGLINFEYIGSFFEDCGFDRETVMVMWDEYACVLGYNGLLPPKILEQVEFYQKCKKEASQSR